MGLLLGLSVGMPTSMADAYYVIPYDVDPLIQVDGELGEQRFGHQVGVGIDDHWSILPNA